MTETTRQTTTTTTERAKTTTTKEKKPYCPLEHNYPKTYPKEDRYDDGYQDIISRDRKRDHVDGVHANKRCKARCDLKRERCVNVVAANGYRKIKSVCVRKGKQSLIYSLPFSYFPEFIINVIIFNKSSIYLYELS